MKRIFATVVLLAGLLCQSPFEAQGRAGLLSAQKMSQRDLNGFSPPPKLDVDKIPTMTSATTSGVTMSASSEFSGSFAAWKAGDKNTGTNWETSGTTTGWVKVDFGSPIWIWSYTILQNSTIRPVNFALEGSNTCAYGGEQVAVDTRVSAPLQSVVTVYTLAAAAYYRCYRVNITLNGGSTDTGITELQLRQ